MTQRSWPFGILDLRPGKMADSGYLWGNLLRQVDRGSGGNSMEKFLTLIRRHWDAALIGFCFFVIGLIELYKPNVRPTGRWRLIGGFLWDAFENAGIAMIFWLIGAWLAAILVFRRK